MTRDRPSRKLILFLADRDVPCPNCKYSLRDLETGEELSDAEVNSLRHYQMAITYDDRVRTQETQPPGLPKGKGTIFGGLKYWQEIPSDSAI